jgi:hypothetical protein
MCVICRTNVRRGLHCPCLFRAWYTVALNLFRCILIFSLTRLAIRGILLLFATSGWRSTGSPPAKKANRPQARVRPCQRWEVTQESRQFELSRHPGLGS